jgi:activating signal cointegrator complex subunit 1
MSLDKDKLSGAIEHLQGIDVNGLLEQVPIKSVVVKDSTSATDAAGSPTSEKPITPPNFERSAGPITVDLKGLVSMHPPHKTSILYSAPTDDTGRLYPFCHALQKSFKEEGFLLDDNRELKLHATIVNTIYAKGRKRPPKRSIPNPTEQSSSAAETQPSQGHGPNADAPLKIDASAILEKYKDYIWADNVVLDRVAICEMGAKKIMDDDGNVVDEVYTEVASIALPK